jgi:uncharacterized RDD family membrane protein YckC
MSQKLGGHYAGFASRVVAFFLDLALLAVSLGFTAWLLVVVQQLLEMLPWIALPRLGNLGQLLLSSTVVGLATVSYFVFFWTVAGQTPGLKFMGLRVVTQDGGPPSGKRALMRMVGYVIATLPLYIGFIWVLVDDRRQGWHDKLARTFVIYDWEARYGGRLLKSALDRRESRLQKKDTPS